MKDREVFRARTQGDVTCGRLQ